MRFLREQQNLNQVERWKLERHPLDVRQAIIDRYAGEGPEAIAAVPGEQERLKWVGLYPQRQGGDAFMLRIKIPAVPEIWRRLEEVGITTVQACGDSARNVLCCPVSGLDAGEVVEAYPVARAISGFFTGNREYANLPRKFKMSVTGCLEDCAQAEINDVGLWPARLDDGAVGFNVLVGGGLSDGPRMGSDVDVFVLPEQAVELTRAVAQVFGELGDRENRWTCRLRYLVQELGPERFREELQRRTQVPLTPAGEPLTRRYRGDHVGVHPQKQDGLSYVGLSVTVGRMQGENLVEAARLARAYGSGELRLATDQNLILAGVPSSKLDDLLAEPLLAEHSPSPGPFERGVVACTGSEFCRFAIVETKVRATQWARWLDRQVAVDGDGSRHGDEIIRMHLSGCSASCAQPQIADIGLRGEVAHTDDAVVEAVDVGLGGSLGGEAAFIDWVEGAKPAEAGGGALEVGQGGARGRATAFIGWCAGARPDEDAPPELLLRVEQYCAD